MTPGCTELAISTATHYPDLAVTVGSDPKCQVCLTGDGVAPVHAVLSRRRDRLFVKDCNTDAGTFVNGSRLKPGAWKELTRHDSLRAGEIIVEIPEWFYLSRSPLGIRSSPLGYRGTLPGQAASSPLCDGAYIKARPGTLTGIIGPSASGKTVFLNLLGGWLDPETGTVLVLRDLDGGPGTQGELFDVHRHYSLIRDYIGYVPQTDLLNPELTVGEALHYRLRLRYGHITPSVRESLIRRSCILLGFDDPRVREKFISATIGGPDSLHRGLSGGERRRANIAMELIANPLILFLDEPTTGLSSIESDSMVALLSDLAHRERMTVVATIHQPSQACFARFDDVLIMSYAGRVAYYGPASMAVPYFESCTGVSWSDRNPAEYILDIMSDPAHREQAVRTFNTAESRPPWAPQPMEQTATAEAQVPEKRITSRIDFGEFLCQLATLTSRNFAVLVRDKANLALLMGQVPFIALLMVSAFHNFQGEHRSLDSFVNAVYYFRESKAPYEAQGATVPVDSLVREAVTRAETERPFISQPSAQTRASIYFLLSAASIWLGMVSASREIVSEFHILQREHRAGLSTCAYVVSKTITISGLTGIQTGLLTLLVAPYLLELSWESTAMLWAILWLSGAASVTLGLAVSGMSRSQRFALTAVPLLLLPQLIFGGILRPPAAQAAGSSAAATIGTFTVQRWSFEGAMATDPFAKGKVLELEALLPRDLAYKRYGELNLVKVRETSLIGVLFGRDRPNPLRTAALVLSLGFVALMLICCCVLGYRLRSG